MCFRIVGRFNEFVLLFIVVCVYCYRFVSNGRRAAYLHGPRSSLESVTKKTDLDKVKSKLEELVQVTEILETLRSSPRHGI